MCCPCTGKLAKGLSLLDWHLRAPTKGTVAYQRNCARHLSGLDRLLRTQKETLENCTGSPITAGSTAAKESETRVCISVSRSKMRRVMPRALSFNLSVIRGRGREQTWSLAHAFFNSQLCRSNRRRARDRS